MSNHFVEKSTVDVEVVIAYLLKKAAEDKKKLTPLQINKLIYLCHGWMLGILKKPLIENGVDQIQAWRYGPVVTEAYNMLKIWGSQKSHTTLFATLLDIVIL